MPEILNSNPPAAVLITLSVLAALTITCRAILACWLGLTAIRTARPEDVVSVLKAVGGLVAAAIRFWR